MVMILTTNKDKPPNNIKVWIKAKSFPFQPLQLIHVNPTWSISFVHHYTLINIAAFTLWYDTFNKLIYSVISSNQPSNAHQCKPMKYELAKILALARVSGVTRESSALKNVWSPLAWIHVAILPNEAPELMISMEMIIFIIFTLDILQSWRNIISGKCILQFSNLINLY